MKTFDLWYGKTLDLWLNKYSAKQKAAWQSRFLLQDVVSFNDHRTIWLTHSMTAENENTRLFLSCRHLILCCSCTNGLLVSWEKKLFNQNSLIFLLVSFSKYFSVHFLNFSGERIWNPNIFYFIQNQILLCLLKFYPVTTEHFCKEKNLT